LRSFFPCSGGCTIGVIRTHADVDTGESVSGQWLESAVPEMTSEFALGGAFNDALFAHGRSTNGRAAALDRQKRKTYYEGYTEVRCLPRSMVQLWATHQTHEMWKEPSMQARGSEINRWMSITGHTFKDAARLRSDAWWQGKDLHAELLHPRECAAMLAQLKAAALAAEQRGWTATMRRVTNEFARSLQRR
jgi:hypothetical protein